jgi:hypothetical protein
VVIAEPPGQIGVVLAERRRRVVGPMCQWTLRPGRRRRGSRGCEGAHGIGSRRIHGSPPGLSGDSTNSNEPSSANAISVVEAADDPLRIAAVVGPAVDGER